jgi:hypothetical protein
LVQVRNDAVEIVSAQQAMRASQVVTGMKHEVIDNELAASVKKVSQTLTPVRSIKNIVFADGLPRKLATPLVELVAKAGEFLLFGEERGSRGEPVVMRYDWMGRSGNLRLGDDSILILRGDGISHGCLLNCVVLLRELKLDLGETISRRAKPAFLLLFLGGTAKAVPSQKRISPEAKQRRQISSCV